MDEEWHTVDLVTSWLKSFRSATAQMSAAKTLIFSMTRAIFRGLQEELRNALRSLPKCTASPQLIKRLTDASRKLSDYYLTFDESPFIFGRREVEHLRFIYFFDIVLDPRISYAGLKDDFKDDLDLSVHLETAKAYLARYFKENCLSSQPSSEPHPIPLSSAASTSFIASRATTATSASPQKNFTARF